MKRLVFFLVPLLLLCSCAQWWQVRPYPDFISAEVRAGDQLRIETSDGIVHKLVVTKVQNDSVIGEGQVILFSDIVKLEKYSKTSPFNACNPSHSLGCSAPEWASWLSDNQSEYQEFFYPSCEQHDYCYGHGAATYGMDQSACDDNFLRDMQEQCSPANKRTFLLEVNLDYAQCNLIAVGFYQAVKKYGASRFRSVTSSYCEYDGPP